MLQMDSGESRVVLFFSLNFRGGDRDTSVTRGLLALEMSLRNPFLGTTVELLTATLIVEIHIAVELP